MLPTAITLNNEGAAYAVRSAVRTVQCTQLEHCTLYGLLKNVLHVRHRTVQHDVQAIPAICLSVQLCRETHFNYPLSLEDFRTDCSVSVPSWLQRPDSYQRVQVPVQ